MTNNEKARELILKCSGITKMMVQNKKAGQVFSFEYRRWVIGQRLERNKFIKLAEVNPHGKAKN